MRVSTNIAGLDRILHGGLIPGRSYLVHGAAGTGKTTVGLHFLAAQDPSLLLTFAEPEEHIRADAKSLGIDLGNVVFLDMTPGAEAFAEAGTYDIFSPREVEREPLTQRIVESIGNSQPRRIFVDGFDLFRDLATDAFHYHRLVQSFFRFATQRDSTLLVGSGDADAAPVVDGVIELDFSAEGRSVRIDKFRGSDFDAGPHPLRLTATGIQVLPSAA